MEKVYLEICDEYTEFDEEEWLIEPIFSPYEVSLKVCVKNRDLYSILDDLDLIKKCCEKEVEDSVITSIDNDYSINSFDYMIDNFDSFLDKVEFVYIKSNKDIQTYLDMYPELKTKKIIIDEYVNIDDLDLLDILIKKYEGINAYIASSGNFEYVSLKQCYDTLNYIKTIAEKISSFNLSPFESIIMAYDIVREREYKFEDATERKTVSRDLTEVIFGSSIVCKGYAELFSAILNYLGINTNITYLEMANDDSGHARNEIRVVDSKYDLDGFYYFDTTWDSKKGNNNFLYSYLYLAKTRDEMEELDVFDYIYRSSSKYSHNFEEDFIKNFSVSDLAEKLRYIRTINYLSRATGSDLYIDFKDNMTNDNLINEVIEPLKKILANFNKPISAEVYLRAINKVRKIEHSIDPLKYPYTAATLYQIMRLSGWEFASSHLSKEEKLLTLIFGEEKKLSEKDNFINFINNDLDFYGNLLENKPNKVLKKEIK